MEPVADARHERLQLLRQPISTERDVWTDTTLQEKVVKLLSRCRKGAPDHQGVFRRWYSLVERLEFDTFFQENMIKSYPGMTWAEMRQWDAVAHPHCTTRYAERYAVTRGKPKPYGPDPEEGPIDPIFEVKAGPPMPPPRAPAKHIVPVPPPPRPTRAPPAVHLAKRKEPSTSVSEPTGPPAKAKLEVQTKTILPQTPGFPSKTPTPISAVDPRGRPVLERSRSRDDAPKPSSVPILTPVQTSG
jgi:hypothetical protein